jgi:hypothetical protein
VTLKIHSDNNIVEIFPVFVEDLCLRTALSPEKVSEALEDLRRSGFIRRESGFVWIRNGLKYNPSISLSNDNHLKKIERELNSLPKLNIVNSFCRRYGLKYDRKNRTLTRSHPHTLSDTHPDTHDPTGTGTGTGTNTCTGTGGVPSEKNINHDQELFEQAWQIHTQKLNEQQRKLLRPTYHKTKAWINDPKRSGEMPKAVDSWIKFIGRWIDREENLRRMLDAIHGS